MTSESHVERLKKKAFFKGGRYKPEMELVELKHALPVAEKLDKAEEYYKREMSIANRALEVADARAYKNEARLGRVEKLLKNRLRGHACCNPHCVACAMEKTFQALEKLVDT